MDTGKLDTILAFYADDVAQDDFSNPATTKGKKAAKDWMTVLLAAFPDAKQTNAMQVVAAGSGR